MRGEPLHARYMLLWYMRRVNGLAALLYRWRECLRRHDKRLTDKAIADYIKVRDA